MYQETHPLVSDGDEWAERSAHWLSETISNLPRRKIRQRNPSPLILCGHGVSMRIENGALVIRDGFTHYPQEQAKYRYFPRDLDLPTRILLLDGSGTLSFDVLSWLAEQGVALARVKWSGEVAIVASGNGYAADRDKVRWQQEARTDPAQRHDFASNLIAKKLKGSIATLETSLPKSKAQEGALFRHAAGLDKLRQTEPTDMNAIYAIEGDCAKSYFNAWQHIEMQWIGTDRRPVPDEWRQFRSRSSLTSGKVPKNRNASHPMNAMLNYAYTVRQSQLHIKAIANGYDPTLGIMHNRHQGSAAYILDMIEPERPGVDATILKLISERTFAAVDFVIRSDGVCRLSPQLARMVAALVT